MNEYIAGLSIPDDATMELLCNLYCCMSEDDKASWNLQAAEALVQDQRIYETEHGQSPQVNDSRDVYEVIRQFIEQDADGTEN